MPKLLLTYLLCLMAWATHAQTQDTSSLTTPNNLSTKTDSLIKDSTQLTIAQDTSVVKDMVINTSPISLAYTIAGIIKDKNSGEGIPFATIFIAHSDKGTAAELDGNFTMTLNSLPGDTLRIQAIGYKTIDKILSKEKRSYAFYIELQREENTLDEFVFHAGEDPAITLLKNIIRHKPTNNPDKTENYSYEVYNKLEVDLEELTKEQFERLPIPYMRKFSFIYKNLDTTSEEKPFLPIYLTETLSDYYFQRKPKKTREFIRASQAKGIQNKSFTKFLGNTYQNFNAYDNFIPVFEKSFVSPISAQGLFYYKYKIKDTQTAYGYPIILVQFKPKRSGENCFFGDFWVVDSIYALQRISMEVPKDANINWVKRVSVYQEFAPVNDSFWFCKKEKFSSDFTAEIGIKLPGFIGRKTTSFRNIKINDPSVTDVLYNKKYKTDIILADTALHASEAYWSVARHDSLSKNEKAIYHMIDTLESLPVFTRYKNLIKFVASGVKEFGPIEIGPYWNVYSSNPVEGKRFRLTLGTTPKLFKRAYLNGYVAYGTLDERFKYSASALWILKKSPRMYIYAAYLNDVDRSNSYYDQRVSNDNFFGTLVRKANIPWKLAFTNEERLEFYKEYFNGFSHQITFLHKRFDPYAPLPSYTIFRDEDGRPTEEITSTEVSIRLRYAYKERVLEGNYYRASLGSEYPIVEARYSIGLKNVWNSGYDYRKFSISVSDEMKIPPLGKLYYNLYAGRYFGTLPYALLEVHPGNEFHVYNPRAFNMMNRYEFISDRYIGLNVEHNIGSGLFNYIPLLKKLKWRQFWTGKILYGNLSDANKALNLNKGYVFRTLEKDPYIELGTGISNIFQIFRLDVVWRVSPKLSADEGFEKYFGIFGSVRFNF